MYNCNKLKYILDKDDERVQIQSFMTIKNEFNLIQLKLKYKNRVTGSGESEVLNS